MNPLDKATRRRIFYGMILLFALLAPLVILYSKGYIVDFRNRGLVATGGIFIKTVQSGTRVLVDSDFKKDTSIISHGALITELLPKRYTFRVEKDSYQSWQKTIKISEEEIVEFRDIFLPPVDPTSSAVFNTRKQAPTRIQPMAGRSEVALEVGDPAKPFAVLIVNPETKISRANLIKVSQWLWDPNSGTAIVGRNAEGRINWYRLQNFFNSGAKEEIVTFRGLPAGFSAANIVPHPANPGDFYFFAGGALFLQSRSNIPVPIGEELHSFAVSQDRIYSISKNGFFLESNLEGGDTKILGRKGLFLDESRPAKIIPSPLGNAVALLDSSGGLFVYRPGSDAELQIISGNVRGVDFNSGEDRMLFWDDHRLWIYWLKDNSRQPFDIGGTKKQIFFSDDEILNAYLNSEGTYIVFSTPKGIFMAETDIRGGINTYTLVNSPIESFAFDKKRMAVYWMKGSQLSEVVLK